MHVRGQIRAQLAQILATIPGLEDHVTFDMPDTVDEVDLPWCFLWLGDEDINMVTIDGRQERITDLFLDFIGRDRSDVTQRIEEYAAAAESLLQSNATLGGLISQSQLRAYHLTRDENGANTYLQFRVQYLITYRTMVGAPTVAV